MKSLKEIDKKIDENVKRFFDENNLELAEMLKKAQELSSEVTIDKIQKLDSNGQSLLAEMNNCYSKLTRYVTKSETRASFAEVYRKIDYSNKFVGYVMDNMKQGIAKEQALSELTQEKELEITAIHIADNIKGIYRALQNAISICQSLMKAYNVQYNSIY